MLDICSYAMPAMQEGAASITGLVFAHE